MTELTAKSTAKEKIIKTEGYWIYNEHGERFLDITCGGFAYPLGYANNEIAEAVYNSLMTVTRCQSPLGYTTDDIEEMSEFLMRSGEWSGYSWAVTGTGAVECALAASDAYWKALGKKHKRKTIAFGNGWHGTSEVTKKLSGMFQVYEHDRVSIVASPVWQHVDQRRDEEAKAIQSVTRLLEESIDYGSIIINPNPWFNGVNPWSDWFWNKIKQITDEFEVLLITDDVASCWGKAKAYHSHTTMMPKGVRGDISCLGKAMTGGYAPLAAIVTNNKVTKVVRGKLSYGHTYQPLVSGVAAMRATRDIIERDKLLDNSQIIENRLIDLGDKFKESGLVNSFRVFGLSAAYDIDKHVDRDRMGAKGRYYGKSGESAASPVMRVCAPLIADDEYFHHLEKLMNDMLKKT
jgi:putrescine aminotransferase